MPPRLIVHSGAEVAERIAVLSRITGTPDHARLIADCIAGLDPFRLSHQLHELAAIFDGLHRPDTRIRRSRP